MRFVSNNNAWHIISRQPIHNNDCLPNPICCMVYYQYAHLIIQGHLTYMVYSLATVQAILYFYAIFFLRKSHFPSALPRQKCRLRNKKRKNGRAELPLARMLQNHNQIN